MEVAGAPNMEFVFLAASQSERKTAKSRLRHVARVLYVDLPPKAKLKEIAGKVADVTGLTIEQVKEAAHPQAASRLAASD